MHMSASCQQYASWNFKIAGRGVAKQIRHFQ
jgi:hypothetical protein